ANQATTQGMETATATVENTSIQPVSSTKQGRTDLSTQETAGATNTTINHTAPNTTTATAATVQTVKPTTGLENHTTVSKSPATTATTSTTTIHPGTQTTSTSTTVRPTLGPQPSSIPTGTYAVSSRNITCVKATMGLQLMGHNTQMKRMEYLTVNPNTTQTTGSCKKAQSELNVTFNGGFVHFTFVK
ncbi:LAMP3 protein, partial [Turnix velox]|nr:LAMP3 protein [Turnix velox]